MLTRYFYENNKSQLVVKRHVLFAIINYVYIIIPYTLYKQIIVI